MRLHSIRLIRDDVNCAVLGTKSYTKSPGLVCIHQKESLPVINSRERPSRIEYTCFVNEQADRCGTRAISFQSSRQFRSDSPTPRGLSSCYDHGIKPLLPRSRLRPVLGVTSRLSQAFAGSPAVLKVKVKGRTFSTEPIYPYVLTPQIHPPG